MSRTGNNPRAVATAGGTEHKENTLMSSTQLTEPAHLLGILDGIAAGVLDRIDNDTRYTDDEARCAAELIDSLDDRERGLLLHELLDEKSWHLVLGECQLDETLQSTYDAITAVTAVLTATVAAQGNRDTVLRRLTADAITERSSIARLVRKLDARRAAGGAAVDCPSDFSHHNVECSCPPDGADYHDCGDLTCRGECGSEQPTTEVIDAWATTLRHDSGGVCRDLDCGHVRRDLIHVDH